MGKFNCDDCGNEWFSAYSWKNSFQNCKDCHAEVITWNLWRRRFNNGKEGDKRHLANFCRRCKSGRKCT